MPRVIQEKLLGSFHNLNNALIDNAELLPHLEASREQFEELMARLTDAAKRQAALAAGKQAATEELQGLMSQARFHATALRAALKATFGSRSQKLTEFGMQPFRGRKVAIIPPPAPAPEPEPEPETPPTTE